MCVVKRLCRLFLTAACDVRLSAYSSESARRRVTGVPAFVCKRLLKRSSARLRGDTAYAGERTPREK